MPRPTEKQLKLIKDLRVIVVDDVSDSKDLLAMYLKQKQARVKAVDSAKDVLKTLEKFTANLVISDIYMPEEDGFWLIKQLRHHTNSQNYIPAIAVTAAAKQEDRERVIAAGYDGYLAKPFVFEDLTTLIAKVVSSKISQLT